MTGFDAELYLRLCGERALLGRTQSAPWEDPSLQAARALVAVGAISAEAAQRVVHDYASARTLREGGPGMRMLATRRRGPAPPLPPLSCRVVLSGRTFERPWGQMTLRYVELSDRRSRLAVALLLTASVASSRYPGAASGSGHPSHSGPPTVSVTDDHGAAATATFNGGGTANEWQGHFATDRPLATDARWIEVDGERVELPQAVATATAEVEPVDDTDPIDRFLTHCVESMSDRHHRSTSLDDVIEALTACGVIGSDDVRVAEAREAVDALWGNGARSAGATLRPRWRSLVTARGRQSGPTGLVPVGVATPVFDGIRAVVIAVGSDADGFTVEVEMAGAVPQPSRLNGDVARLPIVYAATDDRGNEYIGGMSSWSGSDDEMEGQVAFWPALDPLATRLDVVLTATGSRAVIRVPLRWTEPT